MTDPMIAIRGISKRFGSTPVLRSIDLSFEAGKTHVLIGSSGCGKSTLLRIIMGLIPPDEGQVDMDGTTVSPSNQREIALRVGYMIQEGGLFPHLTASQNITLVARTLDWDRRRIQERLEELASIVGLELSMLRNYPRQLSGGQRQRVGLMRALMLDPSLILLDEPLGALDPIVRSDLQEQLKSIFNRLRKTVIIVTHDMGEAAYFGHTITLLNEGRIEQHGSIQEFLAAPASSFVTRFLNAQKPPPELKELV